MKVLVDTCVWSLALRRSHRARINPEEQLLIEMLRVAIRDRRAAIIGPIRQEVLSGIRDQAQFTGTKELLDPFPDEPVRTDDYVEAARLFNLCRDHGIQCGPVDILICAVAVRNQFEILTYDQGLKRCAAVLRAQGLIP